MRKFYYHHIFDDDDADDHDKVEDEKNIGDIFQKVLLPRMQLHQRGVEESWLSMSQDPAQPVRYPLPSYLLN